MRTLKFRAWDDVQNMMHDWTYLRGWTFKDIESQRDCLHLMQYTGLKDKNGKEIYEGDVLCIDNEIAVEEIGGHYRYEPENLIEAVYWLDEYGMWATKTDNLAEHYRESEIIGNIYENPELINNTG